MFHEHGTEGTWYAHASVGTLHVRPILDMRRDGAAKMRAIAEKASELVREYKGAYSGEHGDGLCRGEWVAWQYGPRINQAFSEIKQLVRSGEPLQSGQDRASPEDGRRAQFPLRAGLSREARLRPTLDWSAWNVKRDPLTGAETPPARATT